MKWHLQKIPKIAHFYWGEEKLPYLRYLTLFTFHKYNPDWEIRFYYPKFRYNKKEWKSSEHQFEFIGKNYYKNLKQLPFKFIEIDFDTIGFKNNISEVFKANYLEYYLLNKVGGLFSDTDIVYLDSINTISLNTKSNYGLDNVFSILWHGHTMGFLMSAPNNNIYNYLLKKIPEYLIKLKNDYQCIGTLMINREIGNTIEQISQKFKNLQIKNLKPEELYFYDIGKIKTVFEPSENPLFSNHAIGFHWYGGHDLSMKYLNKINTLDDIKSNNVIDKIIKKSLNTKIIKLTIHSVIKNEPFIYYSIKSVYDYVDKILLYDTGSNDKHTLNDIKQLLKEDTENKIIFKQIPLEFDESKWTYEKVKQFTEENKGKMSVGKVRQLQLNDTNTEFCMIVDGDEVHYKATMEKIVNKILPNLDKDIIGVNVPLVWFYDNKYTFKVIDLENTGRIWRTNKVKMNKQSPNEYHCFKDTGIPVARKDKEYLIYKDLIPYAHFETFLKPWRRKIDKSKLEKFNGKLPEVMENNNYYLNRYLEQKKDEFYVREFTFFLKRNFNKPLIGVEVGVEAGINAFEMNRYLNMEKLYLVDIWEKYFQGGNAYDYYKNYERVIEKFKNNKNIIIIKGNSTGISKEFKNNSLDFVYIDANHQYKNVKKDMEAWILKVKKNGYLAGHDYFDKFPGVIKAVNEFAKKHNYKLYFRKNYEISADWWFKKEN